MEHNTVYVDGMQPQDVQRLEETYRDICGKHGVGYAAPRFVTLDSGKREGFATGARRDVQEDKPRFDLIPVGPLRRLAGLYARGAKKYGEGNFEKGIPFRRVYASLLRHIYAWAEGDRTEDHGAAVVWNMMALMYYEDAILAGELPPELDDMGVLDAEIVDLAQTVAEAVGVDHEVRVKEGPAPP